MIYKDVFGIKEETGNSPAQTIHRLLHITSLVAIGLSVGYETWPPNDWHHAFVIGWFNIDGDCFVPHCIMGSRDQWEFPPFFLTPLTVPLHSPNGRAVQGDCERV